MLQLRLGKMSDSVSGQTNVDPRGYLTEMNSMVIASDADVKDIKKARLLLRSVTATNPKHGPGWIAVARLEEQVRELAEARRLIREGCEHCPEDEDVWLEAARLQTPGNAKLVLADAVRHLPRSVKLWLLAADVEGADNVAARKAVLRKALTRVPDSEKLWRAAVSLESPDDARVLLARAVECVPQSLDLGVRGVGIGGGEFRLQIHQSIMREKVLDGIVFDYARDHRGVVLGVRENLAAGQKLDQGAERRVIGHIA